MEDTHLTAEDVNTILAFVADKDPIIIGGQSISIWSQVYSGDNAELDAMAPLTSKDLDFLHNLEAERALEKGLKDGKLKLPSLDNMTPEAAIGHRDIPAYTASRKYIGSVITILALRPLILSGG